MPLSKMPISPRPLRALFAAALCCAALSTAAGPAEAATPVAGVQIEMMKCCPLEHPRGATEQDFPFNNANGPWFFSVFINSPVAGTARVTDWGGRSVFVSGSLVANRETRLDVDTTGHPITGLQVFAPANSRVRLFGGKATVLSSNAAGVATFSGVPAGQWFVRVRTTTPVQVVMNGPGITTTTFTMPVPGDREIMLTVSGAQPQPITVTTTRYEPPILVRQLPPRVEPITPAPSKH